MSEKSRTNPVTNFVAGGVGGMCVVASGHPFDLVKVGFLGLFLVEFLLLILSFKKCFRLDYKQLPFQNQENLPYSLECSIASPKQSNMRLG